MDALSAQDSAFLFIENECNHMQIAALAVFEGPPPRQDEIAAMVSSKLDRIPRYRQKIRTFPFDVTQPVWIDDEQFDLDYHLRRTAIPSPGSDRELHALMGRVMSQKLDRGRPLWEMWVVEGLAEDRWAILTKTHHCLADGVSGSRLLATMLDGTPDPGPFPPSTWEPRQAPGALAVTEHALRRAWRAPREGLRGITRALAAPGRAIRELGDFAEGLASFRASGDDRLERSLNGPIGPHRRWHSVTTRLGDLKKIQGAHVGTINDIVLAAVAGGLRSLLQSRGEEIDDRTVRSLVPVSTHRADEEGVPMNRISAIFVELPIDETDPIERLATIHDQTRELKQQHQAEATETLTALVEYSPPALLSYSASWLSDLEQHAIQTIVTNVRGPAQPLYAVGRRLLSVRPYVPLWGSIRIAVAIFSYAGELSFGITADYETTADIEVFADGIEAELEALLRET